MNMLIQRFIGVGVVFFLSGSICLHAIELGSTREEVVAELGEPEGEGGPKDAWNMIYKGGLVVLKEGKVIDFDSDVVAKTQLEHSKEAFAAQQRAKGLVPFKGVWVTPEKKAAWALKEKRKDTVKVLEQGGAEVDLQDLLVPDRITILDFYATWCKPCRVMSPRLEELARKDSDVFLRKIDIVEWGSPVAKQYALGSIPHMRVYDRYGRLVGRPTHQFNAVKTYVQKAKKKVRTTGTETF